MMDEITRISKEIVQHYKMSDEEWNEHIAPLIDAVKQETIDLAKEEARMIWHIANAFQNQLLDRHKTHMDALSEMYPHDSEQAQQWLKESVHEFDLLHRIKTKMAERLGAGDRPGLQDGSCGHPDCGDNHRGDE